MEDVLKVTLSDDELTLTGADFLDTEAIEVDDAEITDPSSEEEGPGDETASVNFSALGVLSNFREQKSINAVKTWRDNSTNAPLKTSSKCVVRLRVSDRVNSSILANYRVRQYASGGENSSQMYKNSQRAMPSTNTLGPPTLVNVESRWKARSKRKKNNLNPRRRRSLKRKKEAKNAIEAKLKPQDWKLNRIDLSASMSDEKHKRYLAVKDVKHKTKQPGASSRTFQMNKGQCVVIPLLDSLHAKDPR